MTMSKNIGRPNTWGLLFGLALTLLACEGKIVGERPRPPGVAVVPETRPDCTGVSAAVVVPLRRLTPSEFQAAVIETFGPQVPDLASLYPDGAGGVPYSTFGSAQAVEEQQVRLLIDTAETLAVALQPRLTGCDTGPFEACARGTLTGWARVGFRRTPDSAELARLTALAVGARAEGFSPSEALALAASALVQMPGFIYVVESSAAGTTWTIDDQAKASRLALVVGGRIPDATGRALDTLNSLSTEGGLATEASRWLAGPSGRLTFRRFVYEWLGLRTLPEGHSAEVRGALVEELNRLIDDAFLADDTLAALLSAPTGYVNPVLETFYGLPPESTGPADYRRVALPWRVGVLTHPLVMAATGHNGESSVILRGRLLYLNVLCGYLGPPPAQAAAVEAALPAAATPRARYEARGKNAACQACHQFLDPLGFGFEAFDGLGRQRATAYGAPVDEAGEIKLAGSLAGPFVGPRAFVDRVLASEQSATCFAKQWTRFAWGVFEYEPRSQGAVSPLACTADRLGAALITQRKFSTLIDAWARDPSFSARREERVNP